MIVKNLLENINKDDWKFLDLMFDSFTKLQESHFSLEIAKAAEQTKREPSKEAIEEAKEKIKDSQRRTEILQATFRLIREAIEIEKLQKAARGE